MPDTSVDIDALLREALDDFDAAAGSSRGIGTSSSRSSSFPLHNSCTLSTAHTPLVVSAGILSPAELSLSYSDEIPTISPSLGCNNAAEYIASASRDDGCPMRLHRSVSREARAAPPHPGSTLARIYCCAELPQDCGADPSCARLPPPATWRVPSSTRPDGICTDDLNSSLRIRSALVSPPGTDQGRAPNTPTFLKLDRKSEHAFDITLLLRAAPPGRPPGSTPANSARPPGRPPVSTSTNSARGAATVSPSGSQQGGLRSTQLGGVRRLPTRRRLRQRLPRPGAACSLARRVAQVPRGAGRAVR